MTAGKVQRAHIHTSEAHSHRPMVNHSGAQLADTAGVSNRHTRSEGWGPDASPARVVMNSGTTL